MMVNSKGNRMMDQLPWANPGLAYSGAGNHQVPTNQQATSRSGQFHLATKMTGHAFQHTYGCAKQSQLAILPTLLVLNLYILACHGNLPGWLRFNACVHSSVQPTLTISCKRAQHANRSETEKTEKAIIQQGILKTSSQQRTDGLIGNYQSSNHSHALEAVRDGHYRGRGYRRPAALYCMGQKHSRPSSSRPLNEEQLLQQQPQSQQQQQPNQQQAPAAPQRYAASPVYPAQHPPYGGFNNGQYYGGYSPSPYGHPPASQAYQPTHYGQAPRPHVPTTAVRQTQTIKNQVNLIKKTLHLEPHPADPNQLLLSFSFSATAPCRVSTFVLATEDPSQSLKIVGATPELRTPAYYDKGVNLQFPPDDAIAQQHAIRLADEEGRRRELPLKMPGGNSYPLIIRLETLAQQPAAEGKQLQQMTVGDTLPEWVQAQCTYAKLKKDDDNKWALQVLKQKIWVDGVSYELQEIYGMEATRTAGGGAAVEEVDGRECVICMSAPRDTTVLPCRHMCICKACADALRSQTNKCPICREPMESLLHIKQ